MKKIISIIIAGFLATVLIYSQNQMDALRFSQTYPGGTARNISMGGAFGSLGADLGGLSVNPAGAGVYRKSEFTFSMGMDKAFTESKFLGNKSEEFNYKFNVSNFGLIGVYNSGQEKGWVSTSFGLTYNRNNNFLIPINIEGVDENSMADYFLDYSYNSEGFMIHPEDLDEYYERLAFDVYVIDTAYFDDIQDVDYFSNVPPGDIQKRNSLDISGRNTEWQFVFGANYSNLFYFGASFSIHSLFYDYQSTHQEIDIYDLSENFNDFTFTLQNETSGSGYSFKIGAIVKPIQPLRIGFSFHSPVFYSLSDKYITSMSSNYITGSADPNGWKNYDYDLVTPSKIVSSIGIQFGKIGLISVDVENINWDRMRFRNGGDGHDYYYENQDISDIYKNATNIRTGGEFRLGPFALRGGYNYYGSAFEKDEENKASDYSAISGGIGFRQESFFVDAGLYQLIHKEKYYIYDYQGVEPADLKMINTRFIATVGLKF